ncbi:MAG TPA: beta-ketoacyl synthase N-terminal-like domain-containing protein [Myxococcota bacterium]|mgnify:CR=1 FL=1|nr:beta-ketoacyl synthase N-terminal-like domain-containing protein [Myxococcota bacterium]HQK51812.1 beta-ketoacyl synthase N-terminal-like domain-containing protein [Myxococcota bacterium]
MRVLAAAALFPEAGPGDLRCPDPARLEEALGMPRPRRVGRLARLAAASALTTARRSGRPPPWDGVAVYLGCGLGNEGETQPVVERTVAMAMGLMDGPASPVHFANSVSNSTTFQVAQVLGTRGPNAVLSAEGHSFEAALWASRWALGSGDAPAVLCGGLDEWTDPREGPLARMGLPPSTRLGEGGGWLWLEPDPAGDLLQNPLPGPGTIRPPLRLDHPRNQAAFLAALRHLDAGPGGVLLIGAGVQESDLAPLARFPLQRQAYLSRTGHFPTAAAAVIAEAFETPEAPVIHVHLGRGPLGLVATVFHPGGAPCG